MTRATPVAWVLVAIAVTFLMVSSGAAAPLEGDTPVSPRAAVQPLPAGISPSPIVRSNYTVPDAVSNNSSYVQVSEAPLAPPTVPIVVPLFVGNEGSIGYRQGGVTLPTAPAQGWGLIELNFTTSVTGTIFDTDYNVWVNNVMILFGTLPEYGSSTVLKNVTEYQSILSGPSHWIFRHPHLCSGPPCTFTSSLELLFYPALVPAHYDLPTTVLPLWNYSSPVLQPGQETLTTSVNVPADTYRAVLELYPYGYGVDEFWYADEPSFRVVNISVGGTGLAQVLPFPYVNTGGIDLFAWRPITADFTLNDRPQTIDVTGALGLLEGSHPWSVTVNQSSTQGVSGGSYWHVAGDLLLWTNPAVTGASLTSYEWTNPSISTFVTPGCTLYASPACWFNQSASGAYGWSSTLSGTGFQQTSQSQASISFVNDQFITPVWENVTGNEVTVTTAETGASVAGAASVEKSESTLSFPLSLQTGSFLTVTGTDAYSCDGAPCPEGNIVSLLNAFSQTYNDSTVSESFTGSPQPSIAVSYLNETTLVPLSNFTATIDFIAPTAAILTGLSFNDAASTKVNKQVNEPNDPNHQYVHVVAGSDYVNNATQATFSNNNELISLDEAARSPTVEFFLQVIGVLNTELSAQASEIHQLGRQAGALQGELENDSLLLAADNSSMAQQQGELNALHSSIALLRSELTTAQADLSAAQSNTTALEQEYNASALEVSSLSSALASLRSTEAQDDQTIASLESELSSTQGQTSALWSQLNASRPVTPSVPAVLWPPLLLGAGLGATVALASLGGVRWWRRKRSPKRRDVR